MNGIGVTTAGRSLFRTSTSTWVPFLCHPDVTYAIAMFFPNVGDGIPDVTAPTKQKKGLETNNKARPWMKHRPILSVCDGAYTCAPSASEKNVISTSVV